MGVDRTDELRRTPEIESAERNFEYWKRAFADPNPESSAGERASQISIVAGARFGLGYRLLTRGADCNSRSLIDEGLHHLERASTEYRSILDVFTREQFPTPWAQTARELGGVLALRASPKSGQSPADAKRLLIEGVELLKGALEVYDARTDSDAKAEAEITRSNLTAIETMLVESG